MKIDSIADVIRSEAKQKASGIVANAEAEAKLRIREERKSLDARKMGELAEYSESIAKIMDERVAGARLEAKKDVQRAKDEVAVLVIGKTLERLCAMRRGKEYRKFISDAYRRAVSELGSGRYEVWCAKEDEPLVKKTVRKNDAVKVSGNIDGGIIVKSKDKGVLIDFTFGTMLKDREADIKSLAQKRIFK